MAKEPKELPEIGHNISKLVEEATPILGKMAGVESDRELSNAEMNECVATLENKGLNRHAVKMARQLAKLDPDKREGFAISFEIVCRALNIEMQGELFDSQGQPKAAE